MGKCLNKVENPLFTLLEFSIFFTNYVIFLKLCDQMRFEVNCAKSYHRVISDGLANECLLGGLQVPLLQSHFAKVLSLQNDINSLQSRFMARRFTA